MAEDQKASEDFYESDQDNEDDYDASEREYF